MNLDEFLASNPDFVPIADLVVQPPDAAEISQKWPDADTDLLARCLEPLEYSGCIISRGTLYWRSRLTGNSDRFAAIVALEQPVGIETTDSFWAGRKRWDQVFGEAYANDVKKRLKSRGVDLGADKEYMPELARFRGDPEAVIPFSNARSHMKKLLQKRGWACNGAVKTEHRAPESDPLAPENCVALSPNIIRRAGQEMIRDNPDLKRQCATHAGRMKLKAEIVAKHGLQGGKVPAIK